MVTITFYHTGDGRVVVVCAQKSQRLLDAGLPSAARRVRSLLMRLGIAAGKTCQRLWETIPDSYRAGHCFTDFWVTYQAVIRGANNTQPSEKKLGKPPMWSDGITPCDNVSLVLSA